ncbi:MAG: sigma-70 family RNA polymerase sigma factor [Anaerolineae bacterium]|jgi:RNA polymerase sigma-70 factor (ECF subfamily)
MPDEEVRLIQLAQQGNAEACAVLYNRHYDAVYRYCYYRLGDEQVAQDLAGEVFVRMVEKLDTFRSRGRPLLAWLYTIARNLITDAHRQNGQMTLLPLSHGSEVQNGANTDPVAGTERRLDAECLAAALAHLTEEQRQVILLKFMEGYRNSQVATMLGKTEGAVKSLQYRALKALRRAIEKERCYDTRF